MTPFKDWTTGEAARHIAVPADSDDKYSRGVAGFITGSARYPGAAVLGVEAAMRTGVGMVRYLGDEEPSRLVLQRRPEVVTVNGRVQAWVIGSGTDYAEREAAAARLMAEALAQDVPTVLDGGALELHSDASGQVLLTPHFGELGRLLGADVDEIASDPAGWARRAADATGCTVLLKGHVSFIVGPGIALSSKVAPNWTATAGSGDALAGIVGALLATHATELEQDETMLARLAATACVIHGLAAQRASGGGPFTVIELAEAIPATVAELLRQQAS